MNPKKSQNTKNSPNAVKCSQAFKIISFALQTTGFTLSEKILQRKESGQKERCFSISANGHTLENCMACPLEGVVLLSDIEKEVRKAVQTFMEMQEKSVYNKENIINNKKK